MNMTELKIKLLKHNLSIPKLAIQIGISKKALYSKISLKTSFTQKEIVRISNILELDNNEIINIFFTDLVS